MPPPPPNFGGPFAAQAQHSPWGMPPHPMHSPFGPQGGPGGMQPFGGSPVAQQQQQPQGQPEEKKEEKPIQTTTNTLAPAVEQPTAATSSAAAQTAPSKPKDVEQKKVDAQPPKTTATSDVPPKAAAPAPTQPPKPTIAGPALQAQRQQQAAPAARPAPAKATSFASAVSGATAAMLQSSPAPAAATSGGRAPAGQLGADGKVARGGSQQDGVQASAAALEKLVKDVGTLNVSATPATSQYPQQQQSQSGTRGPRGRPASNRGGPGLHNGYAGARAGQNSASSASGVPGADFDFAASNSKFEKPSTVASGASPSLGTSSNGAPEGATPASARGVADPNLVIPGSAPAGSPEASTFYNKSSSFFDNISSDLSLKAAAQAQPGGGFRAEERNRNMATFGEVGGQPGGRGGFRGRGRGYGGRGRGRGGWGGERRGRGGFGGEGQMA